DDLRLDGDALLGDADAPFDYQLLVDRSRVAWAALALGTTRAVLDYVIPYCNERIAFGEPITNRQAVAFMIADLAIESESLRMLTLRAASLLEKGRDATREASLAHLFAAEKGMQIGTNGVQLLGGHGFIKEHPVELWYRHLRAIAVVEGGVLV
ncbi:MAG: acyl-CoA dehydrogenase, partial [Myxococcales bacterium]|nr:acyl-CoA dehydrogenase [Myxococcales bacterium]